MLLLVGAPALPCYFLAPYSNTRALGALLSYAIFYVSLASSIVLYRISPVHPLAKYPGPLIGKVSKGWLIYLITGRIDDTRRTTVGNRESRGEGEPQVRGNVERVYPGMARGGDGIETDRT